MNISTNISDKRADAIEALRLDPLRDRKTLLVLYHLAGRAEHFERRRDDEQNPRLKETWGHYADIADELFEDMPTAVRHGELAE